MSFVTHSLVLLAHALCTLSQQLIQVETPHGRIQGAIRTIDGTRVNEFIGIPYAKPPTGSHRFAPPQRLDDWNDVRNATNYPPSCPQNDSDITEKNEDCLYLNVFVSGDISQNLLAPLPVMFYIHGGSFIYGFAEPLFDGNHFTTQGDPVVLVVIQYRLGVLGFLTNSDSGLSGNLGLKDQVFALQWVQENIGAFGGDKYRVTIFGRSAGGESVLLHMVSPMSKGLFHRAIAQSTAGPWRYPLPEKYDPYFRNFMSHLCTGDGFVECLREQDWANFELPIPYLGYPTVVIDGEFLIEEPWKSYSNGKLNDAELIIGFTNDDGDFAAETFQLTRGTTNPYLIHGLLTAILNGPLSDGIDEDVLSNITRYGQILENSEQLLAILRSKYIPGEAIANARGLLDAFRDAYFITFSIWAADQVSMHNGNVRIYSFEHRSEYLGTAGPGEVEFYSPHGHEWVYLYDADSGRLNTAEEQLARSVIKAWTSFATTGEPIFLAMDNSEVEWPPFIQAQKNYVKFDIFMSPASVQTIDSTWQPIADFWLAIQSFAVFATPEVDDDLDEKSEKFETDILKMDENMADIVVIMLLCVLGLQLIITFALGCHVCNRSKAKSFSP